jgi:hypothetical protein
MKNQIGIVSYFSTGAYDTNTIDENKLLSTILDELGLPNKVVAWSDQQIDWSSFSTLLIKSTWDYFDFYPEFLGWLAHIKSLSIPVYNDLDRIQWNSDKRYLFEIQKSGFDVTAGLLLEKGSDFSAELLENELKSKDWVIKPLVSGGAKNTFRLFAETFDRQKPFIQNLLQQESFLAQNFMQEVEEVGEYSLLFFNGKFSHAVLKTPAKKDFRVQHYFGGVIKNITPKQTMQAKCQELVNEFAPSCLYARVDGIEVGGKFNLMELELIEPYLFLSSSEEGLRNYKNALKKRLV